MIKKKYSRKIVSLAICLLSLFVFACKQNYTPKPRGYFRINLPKKVYKTTEKKMGLPYSFEYPKYSFLQKKTALPKTNYWFNIVFPKLNAKIYLSYKSVNKNIDNLTKDAREFVYKHTVKADAIVETPYENKDKKVYGLLYEIKGDAASNIQFYLTDSTKHFLRGALYFNNLPNKDSLAPVVDFIRKDILHLIETVKWN